MLSSEGCSINTTLIFDLLALRLKLVDGYLWWLEPKGVTKDTFYDINVSMVADITQPVAMVSCSGRFGIEEEETLVLLGAEIQNSLHLSVNAYSSQLADKQS